MAIGSDGEIGRIFRTGGIDTSDASNYEWLNDDGTSGYLQRGEATLCFVGGRPGNCYPRHEHFVVAPTKLEH